ncbi:MAG: ABC transporter permease [Acidobacteriota bacterium]
MSELLNRLREIVDPGHRDRELQAELESHLEMAMEDYVERGLDPEEARRRARADLGSTTGATQLHREARGLPFLETLWSDLRLGLRSLRRDPGISLFAVLIVGLGVAATTTVFSVADALLLRPLPFHAPERLAWVANGESSNLSSQTVQVNNLLDFRERMTSFDDVAGFFAFYGDGDVRFGGVDEPERLTGVPVTPNFFGLLGVLPLHGRTFEDRDTRTDVVLLSHDFWIRRFGASAEIVGESVILDGRAREILGVLPEAFDFSSTFTPGKAADFFTAYALDEAHNRQGNTLALIGRLSDGATIQQARDEARGVGEQIDELVSDDRNEFDPRITPLRERVSGGVRQALWLLGGAVSLLMLIVCANLSNLLLARAQGRQREMAVHMALGAARRRLLRRLLVESLLLSTFGALVGVGLASLCTRALATIEGTEVPLLGDVRLDGTALLFSVGLATVTGVLFGLLPALLTSATSPARALSDGGRSLTTQRAGGRLRSALVVGEIALACILLTAVGLMVRSLVAVLDVEPGFRTQGVLTLRVDPARVEGEQSTVEDRLRYFDRLLAGVRSLPGVTSASLTDALPLGDNFGWRTWNLRRVGAPDEETIFPKIRLVEEEYLATMGLKLSSGRFFTSSDQAESQGVAVINRVAAERLWGDRDPVGQTVQTSGREYRVVGVVGEARYFDLEKATGPELYLSLRQLPWYSTVDLVAQTEGPAAALAPALRRRLREIAPDLPTAGVQTMEGLVRRSTFSRRSVVVLLAGFAAFGLLLAALGVYAVISYSVGQRRQELGVRMAFGATAGQLRRNVVAETLRPALIGTALGLLGSVALARGLRGMLYGVSAADPVTYGTAVILLLSAATLAAYLPARRTSRLNVVEALRVD